MMMKTCNLKACQLNDTSANIVSRCQPCIALANDDVLTALPELFLPINNTQCFLKTKIIRIIGVVVSKLEVVIHFWPP